MVSHPSEAQLLGGLAAEARRFYAAPPVLTLADVLGTGQIVEEVAKEYSMQKYIKKTRCKC